MTTTILELDRRSPGTLDALLPVVRRAVAAGFSNVNVFPGVMPMAGVGSTAVVAAHRGRGLGLRLKADLTLRLLEREGHLTSFETWNNEDNEPMLRVNRLLGYTLADEWNAFQYDL
jgi:GNAT superfamily N-acetyltransferase